MEIECIKLLLEMRNFRFQNICLVFQTGLTGKTIYKKAPDRKLCQ